VQSGRIVFEEYSETGILARLGAGARNLPFQITRGMIGTDLPALLPETVREIEDPFTGERVLACRALRPDVCLLHAHRADPEGNVQYDGGTIWPDVQIFPKACGRTIVSVERVVTEDEVRERPFETVIPHFAVDAIVEAPYGCHPTSFFPGYVYDEAFHERWVAVSRDAAAAVAMIDQHCAAASQEAYLEIVGPGALATISDWREQA
jgi:glutaconate CoA-transferase subunit A